MSAKESTAMIVVEITSPDQHITEVEFFTVAAAEGWVAAWLDPADFAVIRDRNGNPITARSR